MAVADQILLDTRMGFQVACCGGDSASYIVWVFFDNSYSPGRTALLDTYFGDRCGR